MGEWSIYNYNIIIIYTDLYTNNSSVMISMVLYVWSSAMNLTLLAMMIGCTQAAPAASKKPNFVVLFVDDMGIAQIDVPKPAGIYGYSGDGGNISTPNLAKFASEVRTSSAGVHTDNVRVHSWHIPRPLARERSGGEPQQSRSSRPPPRRGWRRPTPRLPSSSVAVAGVGRAKFPLSS